MGYAVAIRPGGTGYTPGPAASPVPQSIGDHPSGFTPSAKRPVAPATIQIAAGGVTQMNTADLSQAFSNMSNQQSKGEAWMVDIAKVVGYNAELLNAVVSRVNNIEAGTKLQAQQVNQLDSKVGELTDDVKGALKTVVDGDKDRDKTLRTELDAMAANLRTELDTMSAKLEAGHEEMKKLIGQAGPPPGMQPPLAAPTIHELGRLDERMRIMGETLDSKLSQIKEHSTSLENRTGVLEMNASHVAASMNEVQGTVTAFRV